MANKKKYNSYVFPMVISLVLLPCFLAYFIKSEYDQEKAALKLEKRDDIFVQIISDLDTAVNQIIEFGKKPRSNWILEDSLVFPNEFKIRSLSDTFLFPEFKSFRMTLDSVKPVSRLRLDSNNVMKEVLEMDTFISITSKYDLKNFLADSAEAKPTKKITKYFDTTPGELRIQTSSEITPLQVIKRIFPQILFSFILLFIVILAFYQISRSIKKEKQLSELRNDFMSNMTHELKTPVSTIGVALEALSEFDAADNPNLRKEYIDITRHEVERLGLLVDKALNISLYEQGKFVYDFQKINLDEEIKHVISTFRVQIENQQIILNYEKRGNDFSILADKTHMVNVIFNLIENGIKYSTNIPEIFIDLEEKDQSISLNIADKGIGIPEKYQDKVFDKFFRVPKGNIHNIKGHGLGLSYVQEVISKHGGKIRIMSREGVGTEFNIYIPKN